MDYLYEDKKLWLSTPDVRHCINVVMLYFQMLGDSLPNLWRVTILDIANPETADTQKFSP